MNTTARWWVTVAITLGIGYLIGYEHRGYKLRQSFKAAISQPFGSSSQSTQPPLTQSSRITEDRFVVTLAKISFIKRFPLVSDRSDPMVTLHVRNDTETPISQAYFSATVRSPDRAVPWLEDGFRHPISGGLEPGESAQWELEPNPFSEWGRLPRDRDDLELEVTVTRLDGPDGEQLFK